MNFVRKLYAPISILDRGFEWLSPLFLLALRVYVANAFFKSGLTKIQDFSSTVALFESEYKVPVISPMLAAVSSTAAEPILPALLVAALPQGQLHWRCSCSISSQWFRIPISVKRA